MKLSSKKKQEIDLKERQQFLTNPDFCVQMYLKSIVIFFY